MSHVVARLVPVLHVMPVHVLHVVHFVHVVHVMHEEFTTKSLYHGCFMNDSVL